MKKCILFLMVMLSGYIGFSVPYFGQFSGTGGCASYNAATGKLTLRVAYESNDWINHVYTPGPPISTTWAYIKNPSAPGYYGPFAATSIDPASYTCEYDISPLLSSVQINSCHDFFIASDASIGPLRGTSSPPPNLNPTDGFNIGLSWYLGGCNCFWDVSPVWNACPCSDSEPILGCNSNFNLELSAYTIPMVSYPWPSPFWLPAPFFRPNNTVNIWPVYNNPTSTYTIDWGDGTPPYTGPYRSHKYPYFGSYNICLTETTITGATCTTCMSFCSMNVTSNDVARKGTVMNTPLTTKESNIQLSPNPADNNLILQFTAVNKKPVEISVVDPLGKIIYQAPTRIYESGIQRVEINTSNFASGMYQVLIKNGEEIFTKKLSVVK